MAQCSCESSMRKGTTASKTENQLANIIQTDLRFKRDAFASFVTCKNYLEMFTLSSQKVVTIIN